MEQSKLYHFYVESISVALIHSDSKHMMRGGIPFNLLHIDSDTCKLQVGDRFKLSKRHIDFVNNY